MRERRDSNPKETCAVPDLSIHNEGQRRIVEIRPTYSAYPKEGNKLYLLIRFPVGIIVEAVVLAKGKNRLRVAASGFPDTIELKYSGSQWLTASGQPIEFDFLMCNSHAGQTNSASNPASLAEAAASAAIQ
jgi:hypothetical protein